MVRVDVQRELHLAIRDALDDPILAHDHLDEAMPLIIGTLTLPEHAAYGTGPLGFRAELCDVPRLEDDELFVSHALVSLIVALQREITGVFDVDDGVGMDEERGLRGGVAFLDSHEVVVTGAQVEDFFEWYRHRQSTPPVVHEPRHVGGTLLPFSLGTQVTMGHARVPWRCRSRTGNLGGA
jgi:hypothetical protein